MNDNTGVIRNDSYGAAAVVAPKVYAHFAHHLAAAQAAGESPTARLADPTVIAELIATAFWASLRREEGHPPKISVAFVEAAEIAHPLVFAQPLSFEPGVLTKLALAVERPGIHLGVALRGDELALWGTTRDLPRRCLVIEVAEPGLLVVKEHRGDGLTKYVNVAVLQGEMLIRRLEQSFNKIQLVPETKKLAPIDVDPYAEFTVWGVVTYVIHQL